MCIDMLWYFLIYRYIIFSDNILCFIVLSYVIVMLRDLILGPGGLSIQERSIVTSKRCDLSRKADNILESLLPSVSSCQHRALSRSLSLSLCLSLCTHTCVNMNK